MRPFHLKRRQLTSKEDANSDDDGSEVIFGHKEAKVSTCTHLHTLRVLYEFTLDG